MDEADKSNRVVHLDIEDTDDDMLEVQTPQGDLDEEFLKNFCRKASTSFFLQYGLISHQINSYNDFIKTGIQDVFDSMGTITVEPGYDPSKKGENEWKYASVKFGKVFLELPSFSTGKNFSEVSVEFPDFLPRHARLQNMTYSSRMKVQIQCQVYTQELVSSDKYKTGIEKYIEKKVISDDIRDINMGRIPVMVKSDLCWMNGVEKDDCDFDQGGYFIIKGAEKTFIAQEQACLNRIWVDNSPSWMAKYRSTIRRQRVYVKLVEAHTVEHAKGVGQVISVYLMSLMDIPIWILFYALGVSSDKEIVNLIAADIEDGPIGNILIASVYDADQKYEDFRNR